MPADKDFKRLVRGGMQKTGESYTTARAHLRKQKPTAAVSPAPASTADYAKLAGRTDAVLKEKTGCTWERSQVCQARGANPPADGTSNLKPRRGSGT